MGIELKDVKKQYGNFILKIDSLHIDSNEIVLLAGNNGAGKTTLLRALYDLVQLDSGQIVYNGEHSIDAWKKKSAGYFGVNYLPDYMSPQILYDYIKKSYGASFQPSIMDQTLIEKFSGVLMKSKKNIASFSTGNKQRLGIVLALLFGAENIILDEPYAYLDLEGRSLLTKLLLDHKEKYHSTIIVSSHDIFDVTEIADRVIVLKKGTIVFNESIKNADKTAINALIKDLCTET